MLAFYPHKMGASILEVRSKQASIWPCDRRCVAREAKFNNVCAQLNCIEVIENSFFLLWSFSEPFPGLASLSDFISKAVNDAIAKQFEAQKAGTEASSTLTKAAADLVKEHQSHIGSSYKSSSERVSPQKGETKTTPEQ